MREEIRLTRHDIHEIRNVALIGHGRAGKTTLVEAMLFESGAIKRKGKVEEGTTVSDYDDEETQRQISLNAAVAPLEWKGTKINLIDTPGYFDFVGDVHSALKVVEGSISVVCAASGVEVGTELTWEYADRLPRICFVNKMDRENADFQKTMAQLNDTFGGKAVPLTLPIGQAEAFRGIVDLLTMKAYLLSDNEMTEGDIPAELADDSETAREALIEAAAASDDELTMKYLEDEALTDEEIARGLAAGVRDGSVVPVLCGSAALQAGIARLLDLCVDTLPSPADYSEVEVHDGSGEEILMSAGPDQPTAALVFKTVADPYVGKLSLFRVYAGSLKSDSSVYNSVKGTTERIGQLFLVRGKEQIPVDEVSAGDIGAVSKLQETGTSDTLCDRSHPLILPGIDFPKPAITMAAVPLAKGDEEKISGGLTRLAEEDPSFRFEKSNESAELLVSGVGEMHLEVICSRLQSKFGVAVELNEPKVPYRETIRKSVKAEYRHKKQSGGRGQFGHVHIEIEPLERGAGFEFVDKIFGGAVPRQYIPAVEKGIREAMAEGVLAGYPVVDVRVTLFDGSYHSVDSSEMAFKLAGSMAFKQGFMQADPGLLEPIMNVTIVVPEMYMGDVMGDMNKKRGRIMGMEGKGDKQVIKAQAPFAEMAHYAIDLRSITQGRGSFEAEFDHYAEVPPNIMDEVVEASKEKVS